MPTSLAQGSWKQMWEPGWSIPRESPERDATRISKSTHLLVVQQELLEVVEGDLAQLGAVHVPETWSGHQ